MLPDGWGAADGSKLKLQQSGNYAVQNQFYNGWTGGTHIHCVFVCAADGTVETDETQTRLPPKAFQARLNSQIR